MPENVMVALTELRSTGNGDRKENDNENIASALKLAYRYRNFAIQGDIHTCAWHTDPPYTIIFLKPLKSAYSIVFICEI